MAQNTGRLNSNFTEGFISKFADSTPDDRVVEVRRLVRGFGKRIVLDGIDLDIRKGEFVALLGRSGSGKSTLLRALAGLDYEVSGGGQLRVPNKLSVVFQDARLLPWKSLLENVAYGLHGVDPQERARAALAEVGLAGRERAWPGELSGGEQQRVALARALVRDPELLLADEPFGALDALTRLRMHALLRQLCERHRPGVLLVTHDVDEAISLADRIVVIHEGKLIVDLQVELSAQHGLARQARIVEVRKYLLASLGVQTDENHIAEEQAAA